MSQSVFVLGNSVSIKCRGPRDFFLFSEHFDFSRGNNARHLNLFLGNPLSVRRRAPPHRGTFFSSPPFMFPHGSHVNSWGNNDLLWFAVFLCIHWYFSTHVTCDMSRVTSVYCVYIDISPHMSRVTCHVWHVTCDMSRVTSVYCVYIDISPHIYLHTELDLQSHVTCHTWHVWRNINVYTGFLHTCHVWLQITANNLWHTGNTTSVRRWAPPHCET